MNLSEKLAKKNINNTKEIQNLAHSIIDEYNDNLFNKIKANTLSRKDYDYFYELMAKNIHDFLVNSKTELETKSKIIFYVASITREINNQMTPENLAFLGLKIDSNSYPFLSSSSKGFFSSCVMEELKKTINLDISSSMIIKRCISVAFVPHSKLEEEMNEKTNLSIFYEKNQLEAEMNKETQEVKKMKL